MRKPGSQELTQGHKVGEYTIQSCLSKSEISITYKATDKNSTPVVIKEFYPTSMVARGDIGMLNLTDARNSDRFTRSLERFKENGRVLSELDNTAIIKIVSVLTANNTAYLIMDFEDAFSLAEVLSHSSILEYQDIKNIIFPILEGLRILHKKDILHLSISTDNILIRKDGSPVICGFGSFYADIKTGGSLSTVTNQDYAPAEFFSNKPELIGYWSDIYTLGAILYQCITGKKPPQSLLRYESTKQHGVDLLESIVTSTKGQYSPRLLTAIDHALALRPKDRPISISEWMQEILELSSKGDISVNTPVPNLDQTLEIENIKTTPSAPQEDFLDIAETRYKLFRSFIGGKNQQYYMAAFIQQEDRGYLPRAKLNLGALLFSILWLFYRKIYLIALVVVPVITIIIAGTAYHFIAEYSKYNKFLLINPTIDLTAIITFILLSLLLGLYGNYLYFLHVSMQLRKAVKKHPSVSAQRKYLSKIGFISKFAPLMACCLLSAGLYYGYMHLDKRDKIARQQIGEAITALNITSKKVYKYKNKHNRWPDSKNEILNKTDRYTYQYVEDLSIVKQLIVVTFKNDSKVLAEFSGKSFALFGSDGVSHDKIKWTCGSINIALEYLPLTCKRHLK
jgi:serine/threonine protein kinase